MEAFACRANSSECYEGVDTDPEACCWTFKSDTSTDEVRNALLLAALGFSLTLDALPSQTDGHFFSLQLAYDRLATTEHEKLRAARLLCNMAGRIVDHGLVYVDPLTGNRTTWGCKILPCFAHTFQGSI